MTNNPLNSLITPEQKKIYDKIRIYSFFYPFKQKKLNQVGNNVKKILEGFNINYPIIFDFKNPREFSKYAIALIDSTKYNNYKIFIHYNPRFITMGFDQLVKTGLHEYCHIIYRQKEDFSEKGLQIMYNIDYNHFNESIEYQQKNLYRNVSPHSHLKKEKF